MFLKLKTSVLQNMLNDAVKGASNNKLVPLTGMICIELRNNVLKLITTDGTNYLYVKEKVEGEDFYIVINIDTFSKLVSKLTSEFITLTLDSNKLSITGNGDYIIDLPLDENGQLIKFPNPIETVSLDGIEVKKLKKLTINKMLSASKSAVANTLEVPCYAGYYVGDKIVTTNTYKICEVLDNLSIPPMLWNANMVELLALIKDEQADLYCSNDVDYIIVTTPQVDIYSVKYEGIETYAIEPINQLLVSSFDSKAVIPTEAIKNVLERLALFVGPYDDNSMKLQFDEKELRISSKENTGIEVISYLSSELPKPFECIVDIETLDSQVKSVVDEKLVICWGKDNAIKLHYDDVTHIVALKNE